MADLKAKQIKFPLTGTSIVSSSAQIATDISGSFTAPSASFSTRVTTAESELGNTLISSSAQIATDISGSFVADSGSFSTRATLTEATASSLTTDSGSFSTRATLTEATASSLTTDSGSFSTRVTLTEATASSLVTASGSFSTRLTTAESELENTLISSSAQIATDISGSFVAPSASFSTRITTAESELGNTLFSSSAQVDHDSTTNFVANEHINHTSVDITAGAGLTGGGDISSTRTLAVGAGTGVTVNADDVAIGQAVATTSKPLFAAISASGDVSASASGSFLNIFATNNVKGTNVYGNLIGTVGTATQGTIDHDSLANFVANEHIDHSGVTLTAGDGLSGGGDITTNRTFAVDSSVLRTTSGVISSSAQLSTDISGSFVAPSASFSTRVTTAETELGNTLFSGSAQVDHDSTTNFVANEHIDHSSVSVIAGTGMTGGGTIASNRTLNVIGGTGVTANADDIAIGQDVSTTSNVLFANITGSNISGSSLLGVVGTATQGTIDIHSLSGYVANENIDHTSVTITAGDGLTGGGTIASTRTLAVGAGTGITVNSNDVATDDSAIVHDDLSGFVANEHIDHTSVTMTAGAGLTGGGTIAATRTLAVGAGTGVTVNANDVAIGQSVATNANVNFATIATTGNITAQGDIIAENYIVSSSVTHLTSSAISGSSIFGDTQDDTHQFTGSVFVSGSTFNIDAIGSVSSSNSGSFLNVKATNNVNATNLYGTIKTATQATIDHDSLANFVANEHIDHSAVSVVAGTGLTGGGTIAANRTLNVVGGDGITANANDIAITAAQTTIESIYKEDLVIGEDNQTQIDFETSNEIHFDVNNSELLNLTGNKISGSQASTGSFGSVVTDANVGIGESNPSVPLEVIGDVSSSASGSFLNVKATNNVNATNLYGTILTATQATIDHDSLANFVANEHIDHSSVSVVAGAGLTGGGTIAANRTINVVGGDGITANANDIAITAAQTTITSIFAADLKIGEDDQTKIDFEDENQINFYGNNVKLLELSNANTGDAVFNVATADKNFTITGTDGSTAITALDIDMAAAGNAQFIGNISGSQIEASGDVIAFGSSDRRLKDNITPIENPLEKMDKIGGYTFDWNEKQDAYKGHDVGVIAQEIEEILPELVTTRGTGYKAVKYEKIVPLLIESIKELQKKVQKIEENCDCLNK